jgi:multiple sugar transport system substrate-binding protein
MSADVSLSGIAWDHTRGYVSVVATAQRFEELNPGISIRWEKRSLQAFADASLAELASRFDLIVMDHPHTALAATEGLLLPYEEGVEANFLADQAANSVGSSHSSYRFSDRQWTLATDAATPIATWRPDLVAKYGVTLPSTWGEVLNLAGGGFVTVSAFPIDILMHTYMFCHALGKAPFDGDHRIAGGEILAQALEELRKLVSLCDPACLARNPIQTAEWMSTRNDEPRAAYCPFAYGYSNYSRPGYASHLLKAGNLVSYGGTPLRSTLGGAGIAVSSKSRHPELCMQYAAFTASPGIQKGVYFESGGQPGHRAAWTDPKVNASSSNFFSDTLQTLDGAQLRPSYPGYMGFQDKASPVAHAAVAGTMAIRDAAASIRKLQEKSLLAH